MRSGRGAPLAAFVVAFALATGVAFAQGGSSTFVFALPVGEHLLSQTEIGGTVRGHVVVSFHGDAASGCRAQDVCGYSGTVIARPAGSLQLLILKVRAHHRISEIASTFSGYDTGGQSTIARVDRASDGRAVGHCVDAQQPSDALPSISGPGPMITVPLFDQHSAVLATRCAGPRDRDLAAAGPKLALPIDRLIRGERVIDLRGIRPFSADGFAGTITSSIVVRLGKPHTAGNGGGGAGGGIPPGIKRVRMRFVTQRLSLVSLRGSVTASFRGSSDGDACSLLDSCAVVGTTTLDPIARSLGASLTAQGPARLPYRAFLVALGLRAGSPSRAIRVAGSVSWLDDGNAHEQLTAPNRCSGVAPLTGGFATLEAHGTRLRVSYATAESPATECPGPSFAAQGSSLLSDVMPRAALSSRTFTLALAQGSSFRDDGYTGSVSGSLRLTLRRGRLTQQVFTEPQ